MPMTRNQGAALATLIAQINPAWDQAGIWKTLEAHANHPATFADIAQASVTCANDPANQVRGQGNTPERIFFGGPHWPVHEDPHGIPKGPRCEAHREELAVTCRCCRADVLSGERTEAQVGKRLTTGKPIPASQASIARHGGGQNMPQEGQQ